MGQYISRMAKTPFFVFIFTVSLFFLGTKAEYNMGKECFQKMKTQGCKAHCQIDHFWGKLDKETGGKLKGVMIPLTLKNMSPGSSVSLKGTGVPQMVECIKVYCSRNSDGMEQIKLNDQGC